MAAVMRELRRRGLIRSERNPIADYAEYLVAARYGVPLEGHGAQPGYDLRLPDESRVQVKCRRRTAASSPGHFGDFSDLENDPFDLFVGVLFNENFEVEREGQTTIERVRALATPVHGKQRLTLRAFFRDEGTTSLGLAE